MENQYQEIIKKKAFFESINKIHDLKKDVLHINQVKTILEEENLNPCQIKSINKHSLIGFCFLQERKIAASILIPYCNEEKKPEGTYSVWRSIAFCNKQNYFKMFMKNKDTSCLKIEYEDGSNNLTPFLYKYLSKKKKNGTFPDSINYSYIFENPIVLFYLNNGVNINSIYTHSTGYFKKPFVKGLLEPFKIHNYNYNSILKKSLDYGFDIKLPFDLYTENNFMMDFCLNFCTKKDNMHSKSIEILKYIIQNCNFDIDYENKEGQNLFKLLKSKKLDNVIELLKPLIESKILKEDIKTESKNQGQRRRL